MIRLPLLRRPVRPVRRPLATLSVAAGIGLAALAQPIVPLGTQITHGPRDVPAVALTFDDGLNGDYTLAAAAALERAGARGTFFAVGHTLAEQPAVVEALRTRGHLLANHSADHERPSLIHDPLYRKLERGQRDFQAATGECPRFYRPPHGVRTPVVSWAVRRAGMQLVNWDVEVQDWDATDPRDLAARVLADVRPGSVVLLHDGRDGRPGRDRSVLVEALPLILEGLRERGLRAVRLDDLLGTTGVLERCG